MKSFSERIGAIPERTEPQLEGLDEATVARLWNVASRYLPHPAHAALYTEPYNEIYDRLLKEVVPSGSATNACNDLQGRFLARMNWHERLTFIEHVVRWSEDDNFKEEVNQVLEEEFVSYKFVDWTLVQIVEQHDAEAIESTLDDASVNEGAKEHILKALDGMRPHAPIEPRDVIREAIHAVEAQAKQTAGKNCKTLGDAIKEIEKTRPLHGAFREALLKLYGYTNDEKGIRHSSDGLEAGATVDDARFFLIACSAFVSWLASQKA